MEKISFLRKDIWGSLIIGGIIIVLFVVLYYLEAKFNILTNIL